MMKKLRTLAAVVAVSAALATDAASAAGPPPLPFKVSVSGVARLTSPTTGTFSGTGNASHLGAVGNEGTVEAHPEQPSESCPNGFLSYNAETFTAADGDELSVLSTDVACPVGPPGQYQGSGHWTVTGGTGRFRGAAGGGPYSGVADFAAQTFSFTFTGTVSYS